MKHFPFSTEAASFQGYKRAHQHNHGNEDVFVTYRNVMAVIDGATSMIPNRLDGLTAAQYIARFVEAELITLARELDDDHVTAADLLRAVNARFADHLRIYHPLVAAQGKYGPSAAGVVVKIHADGTYSFAQVADCFLVELSANGLHGQLLTPDQLVNLDENGALKNARDMIRNGGDPATVLDDPAVRRQLKANRLKNNVAFGVINGEADMEQHICAGRRPLDDVHALVLMSDGMVGPAGRGAANIVASAQDLLIYGVPGYYARIKSCYDADADFRLYPRFKHMDDATALLLRFRR